MTKEKATEIAEEIFALYEKHGAEDYIGEPVSQLEHMVQAAELAEAEGYDHEVVLAAFFHDIGHLAEHVMPVEKMEGAGVVDHEKLGANYLKEKGFSEKICSLVQSHVQAKRYLTYKFPEYYQNLSPASRVTLTHQGGAMNATEAAIFEEDDFHPLYLKLRAWDDQAKDQNKKSGRTEKYRLMAIAHLSE